MGKHLLLHTGELGDEGHGGSEVNRNARFKDIKQILLAFEQLVVSRIVWRSMASFGGFGLVRIKTRVASQLGAWG